MKKSVISVSLFVVSAACIEQPTILEGAEKFFEKGDNVKIHCRSVGKSENYADYLSWRKNNKNLKSEKVDPIEIDGYVHDVDELTIKNAQRNDAGVYMCIRHVHRCRNDTSRKAFVQLIFKG